MLKIINVVGARPNFMKVAPLHRAFVNSGKIESVICHTGQHYDAKMSSIFFEQLELPEPHIYLGINGGSHAEQTGQIMIEFEKILLEQKPDVVLVVGDVNSTLACSITAKKLQIKVVHVEAGLRSRDMAMPEEINRIVTDSLSDDLFVTEQSGLDNLRAEGVPAEKMHFVGHVMIDSLIYYLEKAEKENILESLGLKPKSYILSTLHRPSNVDTESSLKNILDILKGMTEKYQVVLPLHPRTQNNLKKFGLNQEFENIKNLIVVEPQGYLPFLKLIKHAKALVTDSGGIQEETTYLKVPCITLRKNTERPITIQIGTNQLVKINRESVLNALEKQEQKNSSIPPLWDGRAAERITQILLSKYF